MSSIHREKTWRSRNHPAIENEELHSDKRARVPSSRQRFRVLFISLCLLASFYGVTKWFSSRARPNLPDADRAALITGLTDQIDRLSSNVGELQTLLQEEKDLSASLNESNDLLEAQLERVQNASGADKRRLRTAEAALQQMTNERDLSKSQLTATLITLSESEKKAKLATRMLKALCKLQQNQNRNQCKKPSEELP